jgi:hypothetical protein
VKKGNYEIQKWKNLSTSDRELMDGTITGEFCEGPVWLRLDFKEGETFSM